MYSIQKLIKILKFVIFHFCEKCNQICYIGPSVKGRVSKQICDNCKIMYATNIDRNGMLQELYKIINVLLINLSFL